MRIYRLAQIFDNKYNLVKSAQGSDIPAPSQIIINQKKKLIELYNNFFNEKERAKRKEPVISMDALFVLRDLGENNINKLFDYFEVLEYDIDSIDVIKLYKLVAKMLDACNEVAAPNVVTDFLNERSKSNKAINAIKIQLKRGVDNRIESVSRRLKEVFLVLKKFVPENTSLKFKGNELQTGSVSVAPTALQETHIKDFLVSPVAAAHGLNRGNWDEMITHPLLRQQIVHLVNTWKRTGGEDKNKVYFSSLADDIAEITKRKRELTETNAPIFEGNTNLLTPAEEKSIIDKEKAKFDTSFEPKDYAHQQSLERLDPQIKQRDEAVAARQRELEEQKLQNMYGSKPEESFEDDEQKARDKRSEARAYIAGLLKRGAI